MSQKLMIPVIVSILIIGTFGLSYDAFAGNGNNNGNNGNNGCENGNPHATVCDNNPTTIPNHPPTITSVTITPRDPIRTGSSGQILTCDAVATDLDGDVVTFSYLWTGAGFTLGTEPTFDLIGFPQTDFLTCTVTPFDGTDFGEPVSDSVFVTIDPNGGL